MITQRSILLGLSATVAAGFLVLSPLVSAQAGESALDACRKWTGQGAGMQYKCFDCIKPVGSGPNERWVNTCADDSRRDRPGQGWGFFD